ncbi:hypothetical protein MTBLM1_100116 [Rhodospirillaceae bacterium LM-1]|nr:hypothetical protein MTBLM1_100116 [Rhodospirillaceae bacterium LM-1]
MLLGFSPSNPRLRKRNSLGGACVLEPTLRLAPAVSTVKEVRDPNWLALELAWLEVRSTELAKNIKPKG